MWARIQEMAIRREAPDVLQPGSSVEGYTIGHRLPPIHGNRRYRAARNWRTFELRQFFDIRTPAFLSWQHQARYAHLPEHPLFIRGCAEWDGGVILPDPRLPSLAEYLPEHSLAPEQALALAHRLAMLLDTLHQSGTVHLNMGPDSVLYDARNNVPLLRRFGRSMRSGWHDLWTTCDRPVEDWRYMPPAFIAGKESGRSTDVYSFGGLLHLLLTGRPPNMLHWGRLMIPALRRIMGRPAAAAAMPPAVKSLLHACLEVPDSNRPTMAEAVKELRNHARDPFNVPPETSAPGRDSNVPRQRTMIFVKPDCHAQALFDEAMQDAQKNNAALFFVSIIPVQLAYGEMEQFKARLFRTLASGLRRCRERNLLWGLSLLENVDPERAAQGMVHQYGPERVLCGTPRSRGGLARFKRNLVDVLRSSGCPMKEVASRNARSTSS